MKKIKLVASFLIFFSGLNAQPNKDQRIQDSLIGWWEKLSIPPTKQYTGEQAAFTPKQQEIANTFISWMQKSYYPVGGIGTYTRRWYKGKESFAPHQYGVDFRIWSVSYMKEFLEPNGHFKPVEEEYTRYNITANAIPGSYPIYFINSPDQFLFTWPPDGYGYTDGLTNKPHAIDPKIHPNVSKYIIHKNEVLTVYLAPNNKLPFVQVTIGEYLQLSELALDRTLAKQKEEVYYQWSDQKSRDDVMQYKQNDIARYKKAFQQLREKYKDRLNEPAVTRQMQIAYNSVDGSNDPFVITEMDKANKHYYPIYKIEPSVMAKCKSDQPQWIAIDFPYETKENGNQLYEMYRSITENFNYDYAYDYFFNPEKVKGKAYQPANGEELKARIETYRNKTYSSKLPASSNTNLPANVWFQDDFASNQEGANAAGWYYRSYGKHATIASIKNIPGKWLQLGYGNSVSALNLKLPLPENFTLEFDLATDDFASRTGGAIDLVLSSYPTVEEGTGTVNMKGSEITFSFKAGNESDFNNNNYMGEAKIEIHSNPELNVQNYSNGIFVKKDQRELTNKKNKVHITISLNAGNLKVMMNNHEMANSSDFKMTYGAPCVSCKIPAGTRIQKMNWTNTTNDAENVHVYISNIKITKN